MDPLAWVKTHKPQAALAGGGAIFLYLRQRGAGGVNQGTITQGDLVPIDAGGTDLSAPLEETANAALSAADAAAAAADALTGGTIPDSTESLPPTNDVGGQADTTPPDTTDSASVPAAPAPPDPGPPPVVSQGSGVTIHGHTFNGASSYQIVGSGRNSQGAYTTYLIIFPSRTERWNYYTSGNKKGKWVGPYGGNVTGGGTPPPPAPAPAPVPSSTPVPGWTAPAATLPSGYTAGAVLGYGAGSPPNLGMLIGTILGYKQVGSGENANGKYNTWRFFSNVGETYDWNFYYSGAKAMTWVGPFNLRQGVTD